MCEVVVDRSDNGGDDQDLDERPQCKGEEANDSEDDPERHSDENDGADSLQHRHCRSFVASIVGAEVISGTMTILYE
jgi:hypothetical protein